MRHYIRGSHDRRRHLSSSSSFGEHGVSRPDHCSTSSDSSFDSGVIPRLSATISEQRGVIPRISATVSEERELRMTSVCFTVAAIFTMLAAIFWFSYVLRNVYVIN